MILKGCSHLDDSGIHQALQGSLSLLPQKLKLNSLLLFLTRSVSKEGLEVALRVTKWGWAQLGLHDLGGVFQYSVILSVLTLWMTQDKTS